MAAYAALTSLKQILDQLEHHPFPPISLDRQQVDSLTEIANFLQEFLEGYDSPFVDSDEADPLEMRIADAAYAAEDVIESYIVNNIHFAAAATQDDEVIRSSGESSSSGEVICRLFSCFLGSNEPKNDGKKTKNKVVSNLSIPTSDYNNEISYVKLYEDVLKVKEEMDLVKKEAMEMMRGNTDVQAHHQLQRNIVRSSSFTGKNSSDMVGLEKVSNELLDKLIREPSSGLQVIPITGMGGIGKTTLARYIFDYADVKNYFGICAWVTISQQYNTKEILGKILYQASGKSSEQNEEELRDGLYKYLYNRRYLIIMDDIWSREAWENMKFCFPDCKQGSRIVFTTRQSFLTPQLSIDSVDVFRMEFLDEDNSWKLFSKTVSREESFPLQLEKIGKKIVKNCRGLPLSIVVIGGLLAKSQHTHEHWEHIEQNFNSIVNLENDEFCLKVLKLSYHHLPAYLKPSFLYMGIFQEDTRIRVSTLIKLWVSEGFLKSENGKSLETIGEGFLNDLIDRNLILVDGLGSTGNIKYCKIHDLLRDLCLKEAEKERFYHLIGQHSLQDIHKHNPRCMVYKKRSVDVLKSTTSCVRSFTSQFKYDSVGPLLSNIRLLRVLNADKVEFPEYHLKDVIHELVNSRYVAVSTNQWKSINLPSSVNFLWNLHTLRIVCGGAGPEFIIAPVEMWKMSQLKNVEFINGFLYLPDPPSGSSVMLENLETLKGVVDFKCTEEVVKRIPNIKKLLLYYRQLRDVGIPDGYDCCPSNLECLRKLESFTMTMVNYDNDNYYLHNITFPQSLRKLSLMFYRNSFDKPEVVGWEKILEKIGGSLPLLQKLQLTYGVFKTGKWETVKGQFPSLKFLEVSSCHGLKQWMVEESSHFPLLEHLHLRGLEELEEIPTEIGELGMLQLIVLRYCSESAVKSAKKIIEEQEDARGELPFLVQVQE